MKKTWSKYKDICNLKQYDIAEKQFSLPLDCQVTWLRILWLSQERSDDISNIQNLAVKLHCHEHMWEQTDLLIQAIK